jgi:hypothetical protein
LLNELDDVIADLLASLDPVTPPFAVADAITGVTLLLVVVVAVVVVVVESRPGPRTLQPWEAVVSSLPMPTQF